MTDLAEVQESDGALEARVEQAHMNYGASHSRRAPAEVSKQLDVASASNGVDSDARAVASTSSEVVAGTISPVAAASADSAMTSPESVLEGAARGSTSSSASGSTSPSSANTATPYLPLPPLPLEVFLRVMHFLPIKQATRSRAVSSTWRNVIDGDPRLWSHFSCSLEDLTLTSQLEMFTRNAMPKQVGQSGGIRSLTVKLGSAPLREVADADIIGFEEAAESLEDIVETLSTASCSIVKTRHGDQLFSTLRSFKLDLRPNTPVSAHLLHCFDELRSADLFSHLISLDIIINWFWMPLGSDFLSTFPLLTRLSIRALKQRDLRLKYKYGDAEGLYHAPLALPHLRDLILENVRVTADAAMPILPNLQTLRLVNVAWESRSYYLLLRGARESLVSLEMDDFSYEAAGDPWEEYQDFLDIRDPDLLDESPPPDHPAPASHYDPETPLPDPIPINFPHLRYMRLSGITPAIFAPSRGWEEEYEALEPPTPLFIMLALQTCVLHGTSLDTVEDVPPEQEQLAVLGTLAPNLRSLALTGLVHEDSGLYACLDAMHRELVTLDLSNSAFTDWIVCRLPYLTPKLQALDVRNCADIGAQSVARCVEVIRDRWEEGESRLRRVWVDEAEMVDPRDQWAETRAYKWLAFVDVLQLDDDDPEGLGPADPRQRRAWVKRGKRDVMHDAKIKYLEWEQKQLTQKALAAAAAATAGGASSASGGHRVSSLLARAPLALIAPQSLVPAGADATPQSIRAAPIASLASQQNSFLPALTTAVVSNTKPATAVSAQAVATCVAQQQNTTSFLPGAPTQGYESVSWPQPPVTPTRPPPSTKPPPTVSKARPPHPPSLPPVTAPASTTDFDVSDVPPEFLAAQIKEMERLEALQAQRVQAQIDAAEQAVAQAEQVRRRSNTARTGTEDEPMLEYDEAVPAVDPTGAATDDEPVVDILASDDDSQRSSGGEIRYARRSGFAANTDDEAEDPPTDDDREPVVSTGTNTPAAIDSPADLFNPLL